jgi:hypothetical protein
MSARANLGTNRRRQLRHRGTYLAAKGFVSTKSNRWLRLGRHQAVYRKRATGRPKVQQSSLREMKPSGSFSTNELRRRVLPRRDREVRFPCSGGLIPCFGDKNSLFGENNSLFRNHREFGAFRGRPLKPAGFFDGHATKRRRFLQNSLLISLLNSLFLRAAIWIPGSPLARRPGMTTSPSAYAARAAPLPRSPSPAPSPHTFMPNRRAALPPRIAAFSSSVSVVVAIT